MQWQNNNINNRETLMEQNNNTGLLFAEIRSLN